MIDKLSRDRMQELVERLNFYRDSYYNKDSSLISDKEYDEMYDELETLEKNTEVIMSNSPTQTVGYIVQSKLKKVKHNHPMLSLDKTKSIDDLCDFASKSLSIMMLKMDGLTCSLRYDENGALASAETRGNGEIGEDITNNIKFVECVPLKINNHGVPLTVDGEIIVAKSDFEAINATLIEKEKFSHPRNYASGSIRQLNTEITAQRKLRFIAWKLIEGYPLEKQYDSMFRQLVYLEDLGFTTVPKIIDFDTQNKNIENAIEQLKYEANEKGYPIDGIVITYDSLKFGKGLGMTSHHPLHSKAFKFYDDVVETTLIDVEWNATRTGVMAPVGIFEPVDLGGAVTSRATLHNVSYIKKLELGLGDIITVYRANQVIPKIGDNLTRSNTYKLPENCCSCDCKLVLRSDGIAENLYCENNACPAKNLSRFVHFVSKPAMNIDGLSEATLEKFIDAGFIRTFVDIYHLDQYKDKIIEMDGFGEKSYNKLINAIETSRNVKLENFIVALGIPLIGKTAAKTISKHFNGDYEEFAYNACDYDFTKLEDFGEAMSQSLNDWGKNVSDIEYGIQNELHFIVEETKTIENDFIAGRVFCVTGAFNTMKRSEIEKIITERGGKLSGSVSKKTDYLLTNEADSGSSKAKKALELGTPIMSEAEFISKI